MIVNCTKGKINPRIEIVDQGKPALFTKEDKDRIKEDITKAMDFLRFERLVSPRESIEKIIKSRLRANDYHGNDIEKRF